VDMCEAYGPRTDRVPQFVKVPSFSGIVPWNWLIRLVKRCNLRVCRFGLFLSLNSCDNGIHCSKQEGATS